MALQDIASELMPTLLKGMNAKQKKEKLSTMPDDVKKKVKRKIQRKPETDTQRLETKEQPREQREPTMSLMDLMNQESFSEKKFKEQQAAKNQKPANRFGRKK
jgi:non-homologous end joining protein Ku